MNTIEIGKRLVELATTGADAQALDELYATNVISIEADAEEESQTWEGLDAVREKHAWWESVTTMHNTTAEGPFAGEGDDQFVVRFEMDVTMQEKGRSTMSEVGLYTVADGKIAREVYLPLIAG